METPHKNNNIDHVDFTNPTLFLHQFDESTDSYYFIETSERKIREAAFLDGREPFYQHKSSLQISGQYLHNQQVTDHLWAARSRFIFHVGFCGSTLLARLLESNQQQIICYKEPHILAELANLKAHQSLVFKDVYKQERVFKTVLGQANKSFRVQQQAIVKPSNWVNTILPELASQAGSLSAVFIDMSLEDFLIAILRGGRERIAFVYRLNEHLLSCLPHFKEVSMLINESHQSIMLQVTKTIALTLHMQKMLFDSAKSMLGVSNVLTISYKGIVDNTFDTLSEVTRHFDLAFDEPALSNAINSVHNRHAKAKGISFDTSTQDALNNRLYHTYRSEITEAIAWYEQVFADEYRQLA
ncbi:hypothetical protein ACFSJY_15595 [Thalassotalea euphylliae]|uniref:hypothetical protein n=1 Tax=Thalassotalea euphylliae TaxID=1655234 RepID=UPI0036363A05